MSASIDELIGRAAAFKTGRFVKQGPLYQRLVRDGQSPRILMIACSDSRVDPAIIFDAAPGEIFMIRNVASIVPACSPDNACHGTSAALEFGVRALEVEHVIVLGHGHCGGVDALLRGDDGGQPGSDFISPWLAVAGEVRARVIAQMPDAPIAEQARALEHETVRMSVRNLRTYPWLKEREDAGALSVHGWHFDIATGALIALDENGAEIRLNG